MLAIAQERSACDPRSRTLPANSCGFTSLLLPPNCAVRQRSPPPPLSSAVAKLHIALARFVCPRHLPGDRRGYLLEADAIRQETAALHSMQLSRQNHERIVSTPRPSPPMALRFATSSTTTPNSHTRELALPACIARSAVPWTQSHRPRSTASHGRSAASWRSTARA